MKIAIVGSRTREDKQLVIDYVNSLNNTVKVISGGCEGVDTWAINQAEAIGLSWKVFFPDLSGARTYHEKCERYYDRNSKVAKFSDIVVAFVADDRKGGTENTIKWAKKFNKPVIIVRNGDTIEDIMKKVTVNDKRIDLDDAV